MKTGVAVSLLVGVAGLACAQPVVLGVTGGPIGDRADLIYEVGTSAIFDFPAASANGRWLVFESDADFADLSNGTDDKEILVVMDMVNNVTRVIQVEDEVATYASLPGTLIESLGGGSGTAYGVTNAGQVVFTVNTSESSPFDQYIVSYDWTTQAFTVLAQGGDLVPGIPTEAYGQSIGNVRVSGDGRYIFEADSTAGALPTAEDNFVLTGTLTTAETVLLQSGISSPVGGSGPWEFFDSPAVFIASTGDVLVQGDVSVAATTSDDVVTVNNVVVFAENATLPSGIDARVTKASTSVPRSWMDDDGDYVFTGTWSDDNDFVLVNGNDIVAETDQPYIVGATDLWDDSTFPSTFFSEVTRPGSTDYVIAGLTNNPDTAMDAVYVLNGTDEIVREGVDLDTNGDGTNDLEARTFGNNDVAFVVGDRVVLTCTTRNIGGLQTDAAVSEALIMVALPSACAVDLTGDGVANIFDIFAFFGAFGAGDLATADFNGDGTLNIFDIFEFFNLFGLGC